MKGKLIMTWDISPQHEQGYVEFVLKEFLPGLQSMGFELGDAWVTVFGKHPQILVSVLMEGVSEVQRAMADPRWHSLQSKLMDFVVNYSHKVVPATTNFQF